MSCCYFFVAAAILLRSFKVQTRRFISLNAIRVAAPSSCTTTRPGATTAPSIGVTTMPGLLLCLLPAAEASKIAVTVVPGGGVGMWLPCCIMSRASSAFSCPCSAANCHHPKALAKSSLTPRPLKCMSPRLHCASASLCAAAFLDHVSASL